MLGVLEQTYGGKMMFSQFVCVCGCDTFDIGVHNKIIMCCNCQRTYENDNGEIKDAETDEVVEQGGLQ